MKRLGFLFVAVLLLGISSSNNLVQAADEVGVCGLLWDSENVDANGNNVIGHGTDASWGWQIIGYDDMSNSHTHSPDGIGTHTLEHSWFVLWMERDHVVC